MHYLAGLLALATLIAAQHLLIPFSNPQRGYIVLIKLDTKAALLILMHDKVWFCQWYSIRFWVG